MFVYNLEYKDGQINYQLLLHNYIKQHPCSCYMLAMLTLWFTVIPAADACWLCDVTAVSALDLQTTHPSAVTNISYIIFFKMFSF